MNGAECLMKALADAGISVCFTNPGTTEIHLVAAIEKEPRIRAVLGLFEGVCSGAADGFARMTGGPAATLLHLGPGLANAMANLHNARRARSPIVNLVGDHPWFHRENDAPLASDIATMARPVSGWVHEAAAPQSLPKDGAAAVTAALTPPGQVATLVIPSDCAWEPSSPCRETFAPPMPLKASDRAVDEAARLLRNEEPTALIIGGEALLENGLQAAARIAKKTGAVLMSQTFDARFERGAGLPTVKRLPYFPERARKRLSRYPQVILAGTRSPTAFFGYPDQSTQVLPDDCALVELASPSQDSVGALDMLAEAVGAAAEKPDLQPEQRPEMPSGPLTVESAGAAVAALLPENAIVSDESGTSGGHAYLFSAGSPRHDWLCLTGGSIGQGVPLATGAAIACPDRKVICLQGDGGAMYTLQALWTQAREGLDVTTVVFSNRKYLILQVELARLGFTSPSEATLGTMDLGRPDLDWIKLAEGMGVSAGRAEDADTFIKLLSQAMQQPGPHFIEARL